MQVGKMNMDNRAKTAYQIRLNALLFIAILLAACSQTSPPEINTESHLTNTTVGIQTNYARSTVRIEDAWNTPEIIATERINGAGSSGLSGPNFILEPSGSVVAAWRGISNQDPAVGLIGEFKTTLLRKEANNNQWLLNSPIPDNARTNLPQLYLHESSGIVYAIWYDFNESTTFVSRFNPSSASWQTAYALGSDTNKFLRPILDANGDATLIWLTTANGTLKLHIQRLDSNGLGAISSMTRDEPNLLGQLRLQFVGGYTANSGITRTFWFEYQNNLNGISPDQLSYVDYDPALGWQQVEKISLGNLSIESSIDNTAILYDPSTETEAIIFSSFIPLDFTVPAYLYGLDNRNGVWSTPEPIDLSLQGSQVGTNYATNSKGNMVATWGEIHYEANSGGLFSYVYYVKATRYSAQTGWTPIKTISDPLPLRINDNLSIDIPEEGPQVAINSNGDISIIWFDATLDAVNIFANHYSPNSGWGIQERLTDTGLASEFIQDIDVQLNKEGQTLVMWREVIRDAQGATHNIMLSQHISGGTVTPPPNILPPADPLPPPASNPTEIPSFSFATPVDIWNNAEQNNLNVNVRGPSITTNTLGETFISISNSRHINSATTPYQQNENIVLNTEGLAWASIVLPQEAVLATEPTLLKFSTDGTAYLVWNEDRNLYLSTSANKKDWSDPLLIGNDVGDKFLLPDAQGNMTIVWTLANNNSTVNLHRHLSGVDPSKGVQNKHTIDFSDRVLIATPISDAQGNISVAWLSTNTAQQEITISTFSDETVWRTNASSLPVDQLEPKANFQLATGPEKTRIIIANGIGVNHIFSSQFNENSGWKTWENIDQNIGTTDTLANTPSVSTNTLNQTMVVWIEETLDANGQTIYQLMSNTLKLVDTTYRWLETPEFISTIFRPRMPILPIVKFAEDGSAIVAWIDSSAIQQSLMLNRYTPATGWSPSFEALNYVRPDEGFMLNLDFSLNNTTGKTIITWKQFIRNNTGGESHIWTLESTL